MKSFDETLKEVYERQDGDPIFSDIAFWLCRLSTAERRMPVLREFSVREKICHACENISSSLKWCTADKANPVSIADMTAVPENCPFAVEMVVVAGVGSE